jgi:DnaJ homolog subfamily C member 2
VRWFSHQIQVLFSSYFADRKKVLKHHPDKKASSTSNEASNSLYLAGVNQNTNDDAFFKCIQKAHEVLTNPEKRRQFDSVDPVFMDLEEDMPTASEIKVCPIHLHSAFLVSRVLFL